MNGPSHGGIIYACQWYAVPTGALDRLPGRLGGTLSGYDSVGDFADIWRIWTVPVLSLLPADQHHFAGLLALRLLCIG